MVNEIKEFVKNFFESIGAKVDIDGNLMEVIGVKEDFEKFYGKVSPYRFSFEKGVNHDSEYVDAGSYTMKSISNYLDGSGETTLVKLNFTDVNPEKELKNRIKLLNSHIGGLRPRKKNDIFFRFTFHSSFQYLNEREKVINEIYVHEGKVVKGNLDGYPLEEGSKNEIKIPDIKESYFVAKEHLKKLISKNTDKHIENLEVLLNKEIDRINNHFENIKDELEDNLNKAKIKLDELKKEGDLEKIKRQEKIVFNLSERLNSGELERDKKRSILIEKSKHSLNVNNKLFNTTLIYHPLFSYDVELKNNDTFRIVEVIYNPLLEKLEPIKCDSCHEDIDEIGICTGGHTVCSGCLSKCGSCSRDFCYSCLQAKCQICGDNICSDCKTRCSKCSKVVCKSHTTTDKFTGKVYCQNCLIRCERCSRLSVGENFKVSKKTGAKICEECYLKEMNDLTIKGVFG